MKLSNRVVMAAMDYYPIHNWYDRLAQAEARAGQKGFVYGTEWQKEQDVDLLKVLQDFVKSYDDSNHPAMFTAYKNAQEAIIKAGGVI